jgi:hypothetical protein
MVSWRSGPIVLALALSAASACGPSVDLAKAVAVTDVISGYFDDGVLKEGPNIGWSHILPTATFKLRNDSAQALSGVRLSVAFWADGKDGELDSREMQGISSEAPLAPGASSEAITVRSSVGFNLEAPRAELFNQPRFVDWTIKLFAKQGGRIVPIGAIKVDRRLLPRLRDSNRP